ncbi:MAG TPA: SDR family NAD(P)-dependent oxidoreductase [Candidatus Elarobacter sp.]|nr:SDR family NAD(P)-dependent oxidoreductase [Candidatus Elarobacter sp.]
MSALTGRVALVTGGARGIGAAIVTELVAQGARVVVIDDGSGIDGRDADPSVVETFAATFADDVAPVARSIAEPSVADDAVALAVERFGGLDIVVNCAAILRDAFVFKAALADYEQVLRVNLTGAFATIRAASPLLRDNAKSGRGGTSYRWGRIVNVVSTAALYGNYGQAAYASAKGGLVALTRVTALDLARAGITANAGAPFAATRVTDSIVPQTDAQAAYKAAALSVPAAPVARFIAYLCSERAQDVTGQLFGVRGREAFLFSQPRPVARETLPAAASLDDVAAAVDSLAPSFTALETDLDAFATPPIV